ncbi:Transcription factor [Lachnellula willkommii]|uniref:Transcription factor n=1 Tax=Lachnellula willkommii TaxID=215461 RepID=A0A559MCE3_9HELO|nr:Transcription factor [Lachnellula willkommii]
MPYLLAAPEHAEHDLQNSFDVLTVSASHPTVIAKLLLCVAISIEQLLPNIDSQKFQTKVPLRETMENIITLVTAAVTSDDELTGTIEGIECLVLLTVYQINAGNLRKSWLTFRRAISVAQLMGLHRASLKASQDMPDPKERFLSLMLGAPSATGSTPFLFDDQVPWLSTEDLYNKHLCQIAGMILTRNQADSTHAFSTTQEIDEKLGSLSKQMPQTWWEIPTNLIDGRTKEAFTSTITLLLGLLGYNPSTIDPVVLKERGEDLQLVETVVQVLEELKQSGAGVNIVNEGIPVIRTLQGVLQNKGSSSNNMRLEIQHFGTISITRSGKLQSLEGERILGANPRPVVTPMGSDPLYQAKQSNWTPLATGVGPKLTSMPVPSGQEYQAVNGDEEVLNNNSAWMDDTFLQFTSSQFPTFDAQAMGGTTEWPPLQESDALLFNSLLDTGTDVGIDWDF